MLTYATICSGLEAPSVAFAGLDLEPLWFAEIDPFCSSVLSARWNGVPNLGDFTKIEDVRRPNLLVGGTPCQSFSDAGLRAGLDDPRGVLAFEFLRLVDRLRPDWFLYENVPGLLSSGGGRDFGAWLGGVVKLGYGFAYRVLDAQFFGVPQQRKRVFVVGHSGAAWRRAVAVLQDPESLCGYPPPRRETRTNATADAQVGAGVGGEDVARAISSSHGGRKFGSGRGGRETFVIASTDKCVGIAGAKETQVTNTLTSRTSQNTGNQAMTVVVEARSEAYQCHGSDVGPMGVIRKGNGGVTGGVPFLAEPILRDDGKGRGIPLVPVAQTLTKDWARSKGATAGSHNGGVINPILEPIPSGRSKPRASNAMATQYMVRQLTPREVERCFGFPDDYTLVPHRGKPMSDSRRYQMLGNSIAVPVLRRIAERILLVSGLQNVA